MDGRTMIGERASSWRGRGCSSCDEDDATRLDISGRMAFSPKFPNARVIESEQAPGNVTYLHEEGHWRTSSHIS